MKNKVIALLPMKANSERVKGKNFKRLAGIPLYKWILNALLEVDEIDLVIINTDARNILIENGFEESERVLIRDRKPELCGDLTSMNLIIADDIASHESETYIMTHTTNPLISSGTISDALRTYQEGLPEYDSLFTVNKVQTRFYKEDMTPVNHDPDNLVRTQDLEAWYEENSCLFIFNRESFSKTKARIGATPNMFVTPKLESVDIDEPEDWDLAQALAQSLVK